MEESQISSADNTKTQISSQTNTISPKGPLIGPASTSNGGPWEILTAFVVVTFPLTILSAALIGVVMAYRIKQSPSSIPNSSPEVDNGVYYVNLSASTVALISSYSSTVAPLAAGFAMTLVFYSLSRHIVRDSQKQITTNLPTPYQIGLLITLRSGGVGSLWPWIKYTFTGKIIRHTSGMVKACVAGAIIATLLTYPPNR
jgi:hypothetical protein